MTEITTTKPCPMCGVMGRYMVLGSYTINANDMEISVSNARVVECAEHGIRPADTAENNKWRRLCYMETAPEGPAKDTCNECLKPRAMVGQMIYYGEGDDQIRLCGECNDKVDFRTLSPVRDSN